MEKETIVPLLIGALVLAILGLLVAVCILAYLLLKKAPAAQNRVSPVNDQMANPLPSSSYASINTPNELSQTEGFCTNHSDIIAQGTCAICGDLFCETCLKTYEMLHFCSEHYQTFINHTWVEVETIKTSPSDPEGGLALYSYKEKMWREFKIPSYILTHYKIDIENDLIESHIKLYAKDSDQLTFQKPTNLKREHQ